MFNKQYPKSCTMIDTKFEKSYATKTKNIKKIYGAGSWSHTDHAGIFFTSIVQHNFIGFRGTLYVQ